MEELWEDGNVLYADGGYTLVKIYQSVYLKYVHWILYKWHLNKVDKKRNTAFRILKTSLIIYLLSAYDSPEMLRYTDEQH